MKPREKTRKHLPAVTVVGFVVLLGIVVYLLFGADAGQEIGREASLNEAQQKLAPLGQVQGQDANESNQPDSQQASSTRLWAAHACCIPEMPELTWARLRPFNLPLHNPPIVGAADASFLKPEDTVLGVLLGNRARAYPWWVLANYHAVNDSLNRQPIIVNLCEACNGGAAFLAYVDDIALDFRPCGLKHGTWYAIDFQTGSYWYPFVGKAFAGPLVGRKLKRLRSYFSTWRDWVEAHPNTSVVLSSDEVRNRPHARGVDMGEKGTMDPAILERVMKLRPNPKRDWLEAYELVFGLIPTENGQPMAWTLEHLQKTTTLIQTQIGGIPVLVLLQNQYQVGAYERRLGRVELQIESTSGDPLLMKDQLGNTWNAWGRTVSGPDHPAELAIADGYLTKWYEWLENFPNTDLVGSSRQ